jgi:hypothetical protein
VSAAVDQLLRDPSVELEPGDAHDAGMLAAARQLALLPDLLGSVDPALEQRVMGQVRASGRPSRPALRFRLGWAVAGLAAVLLVIMMLTPVGQTAVAGFMAVFNLGRTEVRIAPAGTAPVLPSATATGPAVRESLTLEQAQEQVAYAIPQPAYLPPGYQHQGVNSYTYPDLPAWVPQPFFLELVYGDQQGREWVLRVYSITLGDQASISGLDLKAQPIHEVQDVDVNGQPGVLMRLGPDWAENAWQEVVWEQDDLILALSATDLTEVELLRSARSVR